MVELWRRRENLLLEASISRLEYIMDFEVESKPAKGGTIQFVFRGLIAKKFTEIEEDI